MRVGIGYDVHRLVSGRRLILGGVEIAHERGLDGWSDSDVLVHAIVDALLGAASLGDIGSHFPSGDAEYRDISSLTLLERVVDLLAGNDWRITNVDVSVAAEKPKLREHTEAIRRTLCRTLRLDVCDVSVKATTQEGLGFVGREEGIAAWAVVLLEAAPADEETELSR
jgi:2-C-methyl-D-erythritol 2,4-cyclodiphosphate synthase